MVDLTCLTSVDCIQQAISQSINLTIGSAIIGFFIALVVIIAIFLNYVLGINAGQYVFDICKGLAGALGQFVMWLPTTFKYNKKKEIALLVIIGFFLLLALLMAFDVVHTGTAGSIGIGSDTVRASTSGEGALSGTGISITPGSVTATTTPGSDTTTTSIPAHCYNGVQDEDEEGEDCGGADCIKCHCSNLAKDYDEDNIDCGGVDCVPCYCSPTGYNEQCRNIVLGEHTYIEYPYCCPTDYDLCANHCVDSNAANEEEARFFCNNSVCINPPPTIYYLPNGSVVIGYATFNWI